jgi:phosphonate dehydrogenase
MTRIVVSQPVHAEALAQLRAAGQVVLNPGPEPWDEDTLAGHLAEADAWMAFMTDRLDEHVLRRAPRLRVVACALKGYDNFDVAACARAGVRLSFVPDLLTEPTAELALGLAIAVARHVREGDRRVRAGYAGWRPALYGMGLHGSTVAVVGLGAVGRAIVDRLQGFSCAALLGVDPAQRDARVQAVSLDDAVRRADYLLLAAPLTPGTRHLVDKRLLERAREGLVVVNIGRGSVVDEAAVAQALESGHLGAYAADVFEMEDWNRPDRPRQIHPALLRHPATLFTPHLGSAVARVRQAIELRATHNLLAQLQGQAVADLIEAGEA